MRIPMRVDYGVRAMVELAMRYGDGPVQTSAIAYRQGIPESYLERLMSALSKSGFVNSRRGPQGGHYLARPPHGINLYEIMRELDGDASPLDCLTLPTDCMFADCCAQKEIWQTVEESIHQVLKGTTLAHLADRQCALTESADRETTGGDRETWEPLPTRFAVPGPDSAPPADAQPAAIGSGQP